MSGRPSNTAIAEAFWERRRQENEIPSSLNDSKLVKYGDEIVARARHYDFVWSHRRPVSVLAVMDCGIEMLQHGSSTLWSARDVIAMRDAVADLIDSLQLIESAKARGFGIDYAQGCASAALARVQGVSA